MCKSPCNCILKRNASTRKMLEVAASTCVRKFQVFLSSRSDLLHFYFTLTDTKQTDARKFTIHYHRRTHEFPLTSREKDELGEGESYPFAEASHDVVLFADVLVNLGDLLGYLLLRHCRHGGGGGGDSDGGDGDGRSAGDPPKIRCRRHQRVRLSDGRGKCESSRRNHILAHLRQASRGASSFFSCGL